MSILRNVIGVIGACALIYAGIAMFWLTWLDFTISFAICSACFIALELCKAIQIDKAKDRHPSAIEMGRCMDCNRLAPLNRLHRTGGTCLICTPLPPAPWQIREKRWKIEEES